MVWKIQLINLLFKRTQLLFTLHSPQRQKEQTFKHFSGRNPEKRPPPKKPFHLDKNCTHQIKKAFTAFGKKKEKQNQKHNLQKKMWIIIKLLKQNNLVSHCIKKDRAEEASRVHTKKAERAQCDSRAFGFGVIDFPSSASASRLKPNWRLCFGLRVRSCRKTENRIVNVYWPTR